LAQQDKKNFTAFLALQLLECLKTVNPLACLAEERTADYNIMEIVVFNCDN
jgi:hypothetical protein